MNTISNTIDHMIHTLEDTYGDRLYRVLISDRPGRGTIQHPAFHHHPAQNGRPEGFSMLFVAEDGKYEQIGSVTSPLPLELLDAIESDEGLAFISVNADHKPVSAQIVSAIPEESIRPRMTA